MTCGRRDVQPERIRPRWATTSSPLRGLWDALPARAVLRRRAWRSRADREAQRARLRRGQLEITTDPTAPPRRSCRRSSTLATTRRLMRRRASTRRRTRPAQRPRSVLRRHRQQLEDESSSRTSGPSSSTSRWCGRPLVDALGRAAEFSTVLAKGSVGQKGTTSASTDCASPQRADPDRMKVLVTIGPGAADLQFLTPTRPLSSDS